jgi:hypothetical protein
MLAANAGEGVLMSRMIRDYVEIGDYASLDSLIERLTEIRDGLPPAAEAELRLRGCDAFGRHLCIGFLRPLTDEEAACEGRYAGASRARLRRAA